MFRMLIDTCVWLDLAKDQKQAPVLGVLEEMVRLGMVMLIVPRVVLDEFHYYDVHHSFFFWSFIPVLLRLELRFEGANPAGRLFERRNHKHVSFPRNR